MPLVQPGLVHHTLVQIPTLLVSRFLTESVAQVVKASAG